jgi:hypothetical protein
MRKERVFVVQEPMSRNRVTGDFEPKFDITPAAVYGDIKIVLPSGGNMISSAPMTAKMAHEMRNFGEDDFVIPTGDPCAIMAAGHYAAKYNRNRVKVLKWDGRARQYVMVQLQF